MNKIPLQFLNQMRLKSWSIWANLRAKQVFKYISKYAGNEWNQKCTNSLSSISIEKKICIFFQSLNSKKSMNFKIELNRPVNLHPDLSGQLDIF